MQNSDWKFNKLELSAASEMVWNDLNDDFNELLIAFILRVFLKGFHLHAKLYATFMESV